MKGQWNNRTKQDELTKPNLYTKIECKYSKNGIQGLYQNHGE